MDLAEIQEFIDTAKTEFESGRIEEARLKYEQAYSVAIEEGHDQLLPQICLGLGLICTARGEYRTALIWLHRAEDLCKELKQPQLHGAVMGNIGNVHLLTANYDEALTWLQRSHDALIEAGEALSVGPLLLNIGLIHAARGDLAAALEWYYRALEFFTEHNNWEGIAHVSGGIGDLFYETAEFEQSMKWYQQSMKLYEDHDHQTKVVVKHCQLGRAYGSMHDHDSERAELTKAVALAAAYSLQREHVIARSLLVAAMIRAKDYDQADELVNSALPLANSLGLRSEALDLQISSAEIALAKGRRDRAVEILAGALIEAEALGAEKTVRDIHQHLYLIERENDPLLALYHLEKVVEIRNRHQSEQKQRRMALLEMEHKLSVERREYESRMEQERKLREQQRDLLTNMMPARVAESLMAGATMIADSHDDVSVMFLDLVNFTELASRVPPAHVVYLLNAIFNTCDEIVIRHGLTKIKTIGDAYLAVGGAPDPLDDHVRLMALASLDIIDALAKLRIVMPKELGDTSWLDTFTALDIRVGIHCGPITAGVIGEYRKAYDVWGDTVNIAARMEQSGEKGRVHVTHEFAQRCATAASINSIERGTVNVKGKGQMQTCWLERS